VEIQLHSTHSLTSAPDGGEWSASRPGHFTARETAPVPTGPQRRFGRGGEEKKTPSLPLPGIELQSPSPQPVYYNNELSEGGVGDEFRLTRSFMEDWN